MAHRLIDAANQRWSDMLRRWAIPEDLVESAPASPYFFNAGVFIAAADDALAREIDTPSETVAREALPAGGAVIDVGVGAGAANLRLADRAGHVFAIDPSRELLDAFADRAEHLDVGYSTIEGPWPDVASSVQGPAHVAVCHHVLYNVGDLAGFVATMVAHASERVVVELTAVHPMAWMTPYWEALYGLSQPDRPTVDDAVEVLTAMGVEAQQQRWERQYQMIGEFDGDRTQWIARRLCLPPARLPELERLLAKRPPPEVRDVVTVWWDTS